MAGFMPDNVDDNLDAAASPIALEREARDRKIDEARKRASPYEVELRIKRLAQQAGVSRQEARRLYEEGLKAVAEDSSLIDSDIPGNSLTPNQLRRATQTLRDMAGTRRDASEEDKRQKWSAMTYLAGGAQNLTGANRGVYAQAAAIKDPEKQAEFLSRFQNAGGGYRSSDPRIEIAQIEAQTARETAAAEREGRLSVAQIQAKSAQENVAAEREARITQNQWIETTRLAAEERARERQANDAAQQRAFDATQKTLDREHQAAQGDAAREEAAAIRQAELDEARRRHDEKMKADELRHQQTMEAMRLEREGNRDALASRDRQHSDEMGIKQKELEIATERAVRQQEELKREQAIAPLEAQYGAGVRHLAGGDYETPQSQQALQNIARQADRSWFGFHKEDAQRMDAILLRLGVVDPDTRHQMVERFGYGSSGFFGTGEGRGGNDPVFMPSERPW